MRGQDGLCGGQDGLCAARKEPALSEEARARECTGGGEGGVPTPVRRKQASLP